jgi:bifunctional DNase/RNase
MIEMHIQGVTTDKKTQLQIAWLEGVKGSVMFPVVVGGLEALSISSTIHRQPLKRPNAHDLMESILDHFDARVERVEITEISQGLLRANVVVEANGDQRELGARASDAVALAAKYQAPIFLSERVLARVGYAVSASDRERLLSSGSLPGADDALPGEMVPAARDISEEDLAGRLAYLEERLEDAVSEERYEDAADIRSEIERIRPEDRGDGR